MNLLSLYRNKFIPQFYFFLLNDLLFWSYSSLCQVPHGEPSAIAAVTSLRQRTHYVSLAITAKQTATVKQ